MGDLLYTGYPGMGSEAEAQLPEGVTLDDLYAYMPQHKYIYAPTGDLWPAASVDARIDLPMPNKDEDKRRKPLKAKASAWLDKHSPVEQMTWAPGLPMIVADRLIAEGGWIIRKGVQCFNLYRPPSIVPGNPDQVAPWRDHVQLVYPDDADHIIKFLAHRRQFPQIKINHALVLGGEPGVGKDTLLEPVKEAVGRWNFKEASPQEINDKWNPFLRGVILRISEAHDLGEFDRFSFYEHMKSYTAAPPDVLSCNEKYIRQHYIANVCGVIYTTNHKINGIFLPVNDRRHYVAWTDLKKEDFPDAYWKELWGWYDRGGHQNVAAYLQTLDLSNFDAKAPPPKTPAFWEIVNSSRPPENADMADALDILGTRLPDNATDDGEPLTVTVQQILDSTKSIKFADWLQDRRNSRQIPHRFQECGYVAVRNPHAKDGLWKVRSARTVVYAKDSLSINERHELVSNYVDEQQSRKAM